MSATKSGSTPKPKWTRSGLVGMLLFTSFWWGCTFIAAVGMLVSPGAKYLHAKLTYVVTNGTVLSSSVSYDPASDGGQTFSPAIQYSYTANGKEHTSDQFDFSVVGRNRLNPVEAIIARYPIGQEVSVYVDPNSPEDAILSMTRPHRILSVSCLLLPFVLAGVAFLVAIFHYPKESRRLLAGADE